MFNGKEGTQMGNQSVISIAAVIDYIENHLDGKLELETVAEAVHYSKYHLHRLFTDTVGMTIHDYVQRRQLTEAAKLLVFSDILFLIRRFYHEINGKGTGTNEKR